MAVTEQLCQIYTLTNFLEVGIYSHSHVAVKVKLKFKYINSASTAANIIFLFQTNARINQGNILWIYPSHHNDPCKDHLPAFLGRQECVSRPLNVQKWTVPVKERKYLRAEVELEEIVDDVGDNNLTNFIAMVTTWLRQKQRNLDYNQQTRVEKWSAGEMSGAEMLNEAWDCVLLMMCW